MEISDLQVLFDDTIVSADLLDPGYSEHASDVWLVRTTNSEVIVRCSRLNDEPEYEFWWGCLFLFGIDPRHMAYFTQNARMLRAIPDIRVPEMIASKRVNDKECVIVERMRGTQSQSLLSGSLNNFSTSLVNGWRRCTVIG